MKYSIKNNFMNKSDNLQDTNKSARLLISSQILSRLTLNCHSYICVCVAVCVCILLEIKENKKMQDACYY